jgi:hypothetical protein
MKKRLASTSAQLFPDANGWVVRAGEQRVRAASVAEVVAMLPKNLRLEVWLPTRLLVSERLTLPPAPRDELVAMAQIQLEKLLPYSADEFVFDLEEVDQNDEGARVLALAVPFPALAQWAAPVREAQAGPAAVGVFAMQLARGLTSPGTSLVLWGEEGGVFVLLCEGGRLLWLDSLSLPAVLPASEREAAVAELLRILLGAELAGASNGRIERAHCGLSEWEAALTTALPGVPVKGGEPVAAGETAGSWMPVQWTAETTKQQRKEAWKDRLQLGALVYMGLLAAGFGWLALQKARLSKLDREIQELQPRVEVSKSRQVRWKALEAAVDPSRYLIEILHQVSKGIEASDIRITEFRMNDREFSFQAEAATYAQATEYVARLKRDSGLSAFKLDSPNPKILANNERAQFQVTGKTVAAGPTKR